MKTCPVCNAKAFDDMDVCYGCLHRFDGKKPFASSKDAESSLNDDVKGAEERVARSSDARDGVGSVGNAESAEGGREHTLRVKEKDEPSAKEREAELQNARCEESRSDGERTFVINVPLPQGVKGVRVAVDFDIPDDPCT